MLDALKNELSHGFGDAEHMVRVLIRLVWAMILGGLIGYERQHEHKAAGLRTHMLVAVGAALFTLLPLEARMESSDLSRVIQGIAAGIGFLGAGTILKQSEQHKIEGLTTAASVWLTAAVGVSIGAGYYWLSFVAVILALVILFCVHRVEHLFRKSTNNNKQP